MRPKDLKMSGRSKVIWILLLIGFMFMEFPGVFFFQNMKEPYIFGFPFIYGYNLILWGCMCVICGIGYLLNWGEPRIAEGEDRIPEKQISEEEGGEDK